MGLFSTKYVHHVGTTIQRVVEDKDIVDPFVAAILQANLSKIDLVDNLLETSLNTLGIKTETYYNLVKNNYPEKLPSGETISNSKYASAVKQHLGTSLSYVYNRYGPLNAFHEAWSILVAVHGLNPVTGVLASKSTGEITSVVKHITLVLPEAIKNTTVKWQTEDWLKNEGRASLGYFNLFNQLVRAFSTQGVIYSNIPTAKVVVHYVEKSPPPSIAYLAYDDIVQTDQIVLKEFSFELVGFNDGDEYFHSLYFNNGVPTFWAYKTGSGIAALDNIEETADSSKLIGDFYPNTYYRLDKAIVEDPAYTKMSKRMGMDYGDVAEAINTNPDITDVQSALFSLGVPADTTNALELGYIFSFFDQLYQADVEGTWSPADYLSSWGTSPNKVGSMLAENKAIYIRDDKFKYALTYARITKTIHAGSIGAVGFATTLTGDETEENTDPPVDTSQEFIVYTPPTPKTIKYRAYRKQISLSFWEEIRVYDLSMKYNVVNELMTTLGDDEKEICLIPLDRTITRQMSIKDQQELFARSMNFVFNSHVIQKIKWYQQGIFKVLMIIITLVVMYFTGYGAEFLAELAAAASLGAVALLTFILETVLVSVLTQLAFKVFVKVVGEELAFIVALVAAAYGVFKENFATLTPTQLLNLASGVFTGIGNNLKDKFKDLQEEMDSFLSFKSDAEKELERVTKLLEPEINAFAPIILGESPDQFMYRNTVFLSSGFTQLNDTSKYVERSLYLPTTNYSLGF